MRKNILLIGMVFISLSALSSIFPKPAFAQAAVTCTNYCCPDPILGKKCTTGTAMTFACNLPANMCAGPDGNPHPPDVSNPLPWTFYYNPTCTEVNWSDCSEDAVVVDTKCQWQSNNCAAVDRCDTGYNRASSANSYKVYAGQCDASRYDGNNPQSACVTGGLYKVCCTGNETTQNPTPQGWCDVQPYVRTCNPGSPTSAGQTACATLAPPPPSPSPSPSPARTRNTAS